MAFPRIFCDLRLGPGAQFSLPEHAANHVARSLRLRAGDPLVVFDGRGGEFESVILRIDRGHVEVKTGAFRETERESPGGPLAVRPGPRSPRFASPEFPRRHRRRIAP
jgi:16S rRNA (uracil1498-N3)-methyltransferase